MGVRAQERRNGKLARRTTNPRRHSVGKRKQDTSWSRLGSTGGATPRVLGRQLPLPPPPPLGAFGQQLVAKGVALRPPLAPKAPDAS